MRKNICSICLGVLLICILCMSLFGCSSNEKSNNSTNITNTDSSESNDTNDNPATFKTNKKVISTEQDFYHYFSINNNIEGTGNVQFANSRTYYTGINVSLTVSRYLYGFVEYSGTVKLAITGEPTDSNNRTKLCSGNISLDYYGNGNFSDSYSGTTYYSNFKCEFISANITITYHEEGLSGSPAFTYESIKITKYNYISYFSISSQIINSGTLDECYRYTINKNTNLTYPYEFVNTKVTFSNGDTIYLTATGNTTFVGEPITNNSSHDITDVSGQIYYYPPAIYSY